MSRAERTLREQRPMLAEFLADVGLHAAGGRLDLRALLSPFDRWLREQDLAREEVPFVASRLAAFISLYFEDTAGAAQAVVDGRILLRVPLEAGVVREFDAYGLAFHAAQQRPIALRGLIEAIAPVAGREPPA
ncbi:MAG: hypothetical protein U0324_26905 [Polyangiales bacterium]